MTRLPSGLLVGALLRRVNDAGGFGVVRARGEAESGAILILAIDRGVMRVLERGMGPDGAPALVESTVPATPDAAEGYWQRRSRNDPDLWVIELDIPSVERLVAETILAD